MAGLSYRQVKDLYDTLQAGGATNVSLPEWSQQMNDLTGTDLYAQGQNDGIIKRASVGLDRALEWTGLPTATAGLGRNVGALVGNPAAGEQIGQGLPRMAVNMLPYLIPYAGWGAAAARLGGAALLSGAEAYTNTGSVASGLTSGAFAAALPKGTDMVEQAILKRLGVQPLAGSITRELATGPGGQINRLVTEPVSRLYPETAGQRVAAFGGGQLAASLAMEGQRWGEEGLSGQPLHNPFTTENLLNLTLGQLPFAAIHATGKLAGAADPAMQMREAIAHTDKLVELKRAQDALANQGDVEKIPVIDQPTLTPETLAAILERRGTLRQQQDAITSKAALTPEDAQALNDAVAADNATPFVPTATSALGAEQGGDHVLVTGKQIHETTKWRKILVSDDESNPPELRGQVVEYSKGLREPAPIALGEDSGLTTFGVTTDPLWRTIKTPEEEANRQMAHEAARVARRQGAVTPENPELPTQPEPAVSLFDHITDLDKIEVDVDAAKTPAQLQKALLALRALQEQVGIEPFNDQQLARVQAKLVEKGPKIDPVKAAIKREAAKMRREVDAEEEARKRAAVREDQTSANVAENTGTKRGEGGAVPITKIPKLDEDTQAIHDAVDEIISSAIVSKDAEQSFAQWRKTTKSNEVTSLGKEKERFKIYYRMKASGDIGGEEVLSPSDATRLNEEFGREGLELPVGELAAFPERDHVLNWNDAVHQKLFEDTRHAPVPQQILPISAGGGFVWGLADYDPATNRLGGKHTLPKSGELTAEQFRNMAGRGKPLNTAELELAKLVVPEAFDAKGNVNVKTLYAGLKEKGPVVETHDYGMEGKVSEAKAELDKMTHEWLETLPRHYADLFAFHNFDKNRPVKDQVSSNTASEVDMEKAQRFVDLNRKVKAELPDSSPRATSYYRQISPFDTKEFPVTRVDVVLPMKWEVKPGTLQPANAPLWRQDNLHENLPNSLGWAMVQFVPLNGETVMFVGEQQSRWGQAKQKEDAQIKANAKRVNVPEDRIRAHMDPSITTPGHPLLELQHQLILKALIAEAQKRGVSKIVLSDGETAMMTEGHDKVGSSSRTFASAEEAEQFKKDHLQGSLITDAQNPLRLIAPSSDRLEGFTPNAPEQSGGMRLHYDLTLPSALKKLTGAEGEKVELGTHKNAKETPLVRPVGQAGWIFAGDIQHEVFASKAEAQAAADKIVKGSPVFRNPNGWPKSSVTGTAFDLSRAFDTLGAQGGFTLGDPARAPQLQTPRTFVSDIPSVQELSARLTTDGHGLVQELLGDSDPQVVAIAKDLQARFPKALSRIDSGVYEVPSSYAARRPANRVGLFFDRSLPSMQGFTRNNVILHELIHGLTLHELANPKVNPRVIQDLTDLRLRLVEALPAKLKAKYQEAVDSDWYHRFSMGAADMEELHQNPQYAQILYSLLNNDELVAQAFSARPVREFMQSVGGKKESGWQKFTNWVRRLLGMGDKVGGTAFGDFLSTTSQLLTNGEFVSDFANFGERFMEAQGKGGVLGREQTQRALGIVADSSHGFDEPLTIASSLDLSAARSKANSELRRAKREYENLLRDSPDDAIHVNSVLAELGHKDIDSLVTSAIGDGQDISSALDLLPPEATSYVYAKLRDAKDVLDIIHAASAEKNKGMVNLADPKLLRKSIEPVRRELMRALEHEEFAMQMATELSGLSGVEPSGFMDALPRMAPKAFEDFVEEAKDVGGKSLAALSKYLEPVGQWARRVPEVAEAVSKGFQLQANSRKMFHEAVKWLGMDTSSEFVDLLTHESVKQTETALANPKLADKIHQWMYLNNKKGGDKVQMLPENDPDVAKLLSGLTPEQKATVQDVVNKAGKVTQMMNAQKLEKMGQIAAVNGAGLAGISSGLKTRDNVALAARLLDGIQKSADPMTSTDGMVSIQSVQQRMQPDAFIELYDFLKGEADKLKLWKTYFDANPFWATAQRTERFLIKAFNKAGKPVTLQASTIKEANDIVAKKGLKLKEPPVDQWAGKEDEPFAFPNMSPEMAKRMQEIEQNQFDMLAKALSPDDLAEVRRTSPVTQILREAASQQSISQVQAPPRLLSQGAEELPWMYNHISWAQREANFWSRQLLRAQARTYLKDVETKDNPEMVQRLKTHFDNLLMPDPPIAQKLTRFASTWFLGYNLATSLINTAQPFMTHVSELTAMSGKPMDSYRRILNALREVGGHVTGGKEWANKEHEMLMHEAVKDGEIGLGQYDDEAAAQESIATNFKRAMKKEAPKTIGEQASTIAGAYSKVGMMLFQHGEQVNSRAALLAGFDYYREQGLNFEDAKAKAYEFNHAVNFGGGRAQRPVGIYSSRSPFLRGAAMLGTSLQSYVLGTTAQMVRYLQKGFFRPDGLTPHETFAARRAAIQMLATQFVAAGVLGMPFVSGALALLDKAFPELELNKKTREFVGSFLSGDNENGSSLTDIAMTGVPSMFGWDMQSRLSMGNTLPGVSEVNGFQPENLMGPTANIVRNFTNGVTGWLKGDAKAGLNFLPPAVKKLLEASQAALSSGQVGGGIQDYQGRPLASPTPGEYAGSLLGFQPKRLSDQNAAARMLKQSEEVLRTQESQFRSAQAEQILKGNFGSVRQELLAKKRENNQYDDVGAVQAIARATEELAFPRDLRREGTQQGGAGRSSLLATYGVSSGGVASELERLQFRKTIEGKLGLVTNDKKDVQVAMLMDQIKQKDPAATRLQIKAAALEALRRTQPRGLMP